MSPVLFKTIIIDDEPPALQRLLEMLAKFPSTFEIIGHASNGREAIKLINALNPDLIFLDIQMPGMTGFEMLQELENIPMVIFCTAYDQFSLQAFETNAVDYLIKPVRIERLEQTIAKLNFFKRDFNPDKIMGLLKDLTQKHRSKVMTSITVRNGTKLTFVKLEDIAYFEACDKYVSLYTKQGKENITDQSLIELEEKLPEYFLRVQRSVIINTSMVKEAHVYFHSRYSIIMDDYSQTKIITGRNYQQQVKKWMGVL